MIEKDTYKKTSINLPEDLLSEIRRMLPEASVRNTTDFIIKALRFYLSYLHSGPSADYYSNVLYQQFSARQTWHEQKLNTAMFKLSTSLSELTYLLAAVFNMSKRDIATAQSLALRHVRNTNSAICYADASKKIVVADKLNGVKMVVDTPAAGGAQQYASGAQPLTRGESGMADAKPAGTGADNVTSGKIHGALGSAFISNTPAANGASRFDSGE